jgi:hypothetical protein
MGNLAKSLPGAGLARYAFYFYEQFRPVVPHDASGWSAKGELKLAEIAKLAGKS